MTFQWNFLSAFLYCELFVVVILLLPFISPITWKKIFKSNFVQKFSAGAKYYFNFIICVFSLLFLDSIRELLKYSNIEHKDLLTAHAESHAHMKQFRSQRNFYIAGFALFLWFIIRRLVNLLSACARKMADSKAALKQVEGVRRHFEQLTANNSHKIDSKERDAELEKYKQEVIQAEQTINVLHERYEQATEDFNKLREEHRKLQIQLAILSDNNESSKDK